MQRKSRPRTALDSLLSAERKGLLTDGSELSSEEDLLKINQHNVPTSEDEKSDVSIPLPPRKVKRSKSALTSKAEVKVPLKDDNDTDSSDIIILCSGTVSGIHKIC